MTLNEFINKLNSGARWDVGVSINRSNALPLDANSVFFSLEDAESYVAGTLEGRLANAYPGQLLAVVTEAATTIYYIDINAEGVMSLKEVGAKVEAANASIEIVDGKITIGGFAAADSLTLPQKQSDGTVKWVPISAIVEGDGNTVTEVKAADKTIDVQSTQTTDEDGKVTNIKYDVKVNVSKEEGNTVEVKEDGIFVAAPKAYDDTQVKADIKAVSDLVGTTSVESQIDAKIEELDLGNTYAEKEHTHKKEDITDFDHTHEIEDVNGLQDALDAKSEEGHTHTKDEITDFTHTHAAADITDLDTTIKGYDYATKTEAQGYADAKDEAIEAAKKAGDDAQAYAEGVADRVTDVEAAIEVLNGDATVEGSVTKTVKDAINAFATEITENDTIDTFKELVDYVGEHGGEAAEMASAISTLEEKVGEKSVKVQIEEAISAENLGQYATDTDLSNAIDAALKEAKKYADDNDSVYDDSGLRGRIEALEEVDHEHANKNVLDGITEQNITDWNDAVSKEHEHENKDVLDGITSAKVEAWDTAVSKEHEHTFTDEEVEEVISEVASLGSLAKANSVSELSSDGGYPVHARLIEGDSSDARGYLEISDESGSNNKTYLGADGTIIVKHKATSGEDEDRDLINGTIATTGDVNAVSNALNEYIESNNEEVAKKANQSDLDELAGIKSVSAELNIDDNGLLSLVSVSQDKVAGLVGALDGKVDKISSEYKGKQVAWTLLSPENQDKLAALVIGENGVEISGKVNADNVEGLGTWLTTNRDSVGGLISSAKESKLDGIEAGAQVNKIEGIKFNGVLLEIGEDKTVDIVHNIAIATTESLGVVKASTAENEIAVANDGTMSVNSLNVNKLVQTEGEELIIDCGAAAK